MVFRVGGPSWRVAARQLGPPTRICVAIIDPIGPRESHRSDRFTVISSIRSIGSVISSIRSIHGNLIDPRAPSTKLTAHTPREWKKFDTFLRRISSCFGLTLCWGAGGAVSQTAVSDSCQTTVSDSCQTAVWDSSQGAVWDSSQAAVWDSSQTAVSDNSQTAVSDSCQTAVWDSSPAAVWDTSQTAVSDSFQTAVWDSSQAALWDSCQTAVWDSSQTAVWDSSQTAPRQLSGTAPRQLSGTARRQLSGTAIWAAPRQLSGTAPRQLSGSSVSRGVSRENRGFSLETPLKMPHLKMLKSETNPKGFSPHHRNSFPGAAVVRREPLRVDAQTTGVRSPGPAF